MKKDRELLPASVKVFHYDLHISTNLKDDFVYTGLVKIHIDILDKKTSSLKFHVRQIEIVSCKLICEGNAVFDVTSQQFNKEEEAICFYFENSIPMGKAVFEVEYKGTHNSEMAGFYRGKQPSRNGETRWMVSTKFEPIDARRCVICADEPSQKATFACSLEIDKGLTALGNMPVTKTEDISETRQKITFETSPKMSTYLLAFCVGEFDYVETTTKNNVLLRVYTPVNKKHLGEFALDVGSKVLDMYDDMFGSPYPLPKLDMIAIPEFASGAMENWGLITYRETALLIDKSASSRQRQRVATVVAHEIAHMWFGNLVTMAWWDDLWLNEGFATWMQNYAVDKIFPKWNLWNQFIEGSQGSALELDALTSSHPIQVPIKRAQNVKEIFDLISYHKGASVIRLINAVLGETDFKAGLKLYMTRHAYGNTETVDLWNAWEETSKKPINQVMSSWTEQQGFPVVSVVSSKFEGDKCTLKLKQEWFLADGTVPENKRWAIPLFVVTEKGMQQLDIFNEQEKEITFKAGKKRWVKLNAEQHVPLHVNYDELLWDNLCTAIKEKELADIEKCGVLIDSLALVKAKRLKPGILLDLLKSFHAEDNLTVWCLLLDTFKNIKDVIGDDEELSKKFIAFVKQKIMPVFTEIGWDEKDSDSHLTKLLRGRLISSLATYAKDEPSILKEANSKFESYLKDQKTANLPSSYRATVFRLVLSNSDSDIEFNSLLSVIDKLETNIEKLDILLSIGFVKDVKLKKKALEWCISGKVKLQDFFYVIASVSLSGPIGVQLSWQFFKDNFQKLKEMLKEADPSLMGACIVYSTYGFNTTAQAKDVQSFFEVNKTKNGRKISQTVEKITNRAALREIILSSENFTKGF